MLIFFSSRRRHTRLQGDWSSDVCSSDLPDSGRPDSEWPDSEWPDAQRLEAQRLEAQRLEAQRLEAQRLEAQRLEAQRLEAANPPRPPAAGTGPEVTDHLGPLSGPPSATVPGVPAARPGDPGGW